MTFDEIGNNAPLIKRVSRAIISGRVSHAYIFEGAARADRAAAADSFAKAVLCGEHPGRGCDSCIVCKKIDHGNHGDVLYVEKSENSVKDEAIEELQEKLKKKPFSGDRNIAVIKDADAMTSRAQNRLLKTLEEPFPGTIILLLSDNVENFARTIRSRCIVLRWNPFHEEQGGEETEKAEALVKMLAGGEPFYARKRMVAGLFENRDEALALLDRMEILFGGYLRERSYGKKTIKAAIDSIEEARQELKRGMQPAQSLKRMILKMEGI